MLKKVFTVWIIISMVFTLTGCSQEKNSQETIIKNEEISIANQTAQKKVNEIKNSAVPNFEEIYKNTVEIDVNFNSGVCFVHIKQKSKITKCCLIF